jgi:hypothetical protein
MTLGTSSPNSSNNPDYPFDLVPIPPANQQNRNATLTQGNLQMRVFDTWSAEKNTGGGYAYGQGFGLTPNPNTDAWNAGHFASPANGPASPTTIPLRVRMRALQIKLRIWDVKSRQTRQITIIQDV